VAIVRAIGFSARLVIMDEPTSSLDEHEVETLLGVIRQLKTDGVSVIYVSHKLDELYAVCDRVTIMRDGRTVRSGAMNKISKLELVSTMLGRDVAKTEGHTTAFGGHDSRAGELLLDASHLATKHAVRDASFSVRRGEIVGFAGLLGAGRTETARLVFGVDRLKSGAMSLEGRPYAPTRTADAVAAGMGFCSEDRKTEGIVSEMSVAEMSVAENMTLAMLPRISHRGVVDEREQRKIVDHYIKSLKIKCTGPDQRIRELSGGNQQKVCSRVGLQ
jgi:ribose transport system ATP-binding protein